MAVSGGTAAVAITSDGAYRLVVERASQQIALYDPAAKRLLATVSVGGAPHAVLTGPYPPPPTGQSRSRPSQSSAAPRDQAVGLLLRLGPIAALVLALLAIGVYWMRGRVDTSKRQ